MSAVGNATPLLAIDAIVVDTETTGLDAKKARIVEIAAVRLISGRIAENETFRSLVNPGQAIPADVIKVHGIDDAKVAAAPGFRALWPAWTDFVGEGLWIGHAIGFDLAVVRRECARAGVAFAPPRALDTRLLAEAAEPELADFSLERMAAWLGVEASPRHSALGDALTTARIFHALVPKLRERGIRTVGEALQVCSALTTRLEEQHRAGWAAVAEPPRALGELELRRLDSYPYRHRVREIMRSPAEFIAADTPLRDALSILMAKRISSLYVRRDGADASRAADSKIVTERDILRAIAEQGTQALDVSVDRIASGPLIGVPADDFVYRAIGRMGRRNIRHLAALDNIGRVIGALSARDLLRLRAGEALSLGDGLEEAADVYDLASAWARLPLVIESLISEGVSGRDIAALISMELCALTRASARIAEDRMRLRGQGAPPCSYAVAVLGSGGRGESLLAMDQDNALIFAEGGPGESSDRWFENLATDMADILHEAGIPYCKGGIMAKNAKWRGSVATWKARIAGWIASARPQDLLAVDIFFDLRPVHGEGVLAESLWRTAFDQARGNAGFAKLLAEAAGTVEPAFGLFGGIRTDKGRIDLKKAGLFGIVSAARVLAICHHVVERSTPARLAGVAALGIGTSRDLDAVAQAQSTLLDLILTQQVEDMHSGTPPTNAVLVKRLNGADRQRLRAALQTVRHLDDLTRDLLFPGR